VPAPGAGTIVRAEWDFDGTGSWPRQHQLDGATARVRETLEHAFDAVGTYFPSVRVASHRSGDRAAPDGHVLNLARVRVEVRA
jgi:hypothetical protein